MSTDPTAASSRRGRRKPLGEILVQHGVITPDQLKEALSRKNEGNARLGRLLVDLGLATETQICEALAEQLQMPAADMVAVDVSNEILNKVPKELALKHTCLPWFVEGRELYLIMADPTNIAAADAVAFATGLKVRPVVAPESEILSALERFYKAEESSLAQFENLSLSEQLLVVSETQTDAAEEDVEKAALHEPVVKLVNAILADAVRAGASDIHIEPQERSVVLRYRVDGLLRLVMSMPKRVQNRVLSRLKVMSHMDISERRKPQDGRTRLVIGQTAYDMRVSTLPAAEGEKAVIRILVQARAQVKLEDLGMETDLLATFRELLHRPQGMILVTGPTGSGKTSTLYAAVNMLRSDTTNIVTVEDPIEYRVPGITQVAVSDKAGLTFAAGLRSILRQDPNIVMVGEIRDLETAEVAFQAAQTGHLVLSTLHTNDAPGAATRLVEMGIPSYLVASSVIAIVAQRLVRRLCDCRTKLPDGTAQPKGCEACRFSGFKGRMAVHELMRLTPRVRSVLLARSSDDFVRTAARASGMRTMYEDGLRKIARGLTAREELVRVVPPDEVAEEESIAHDAGEAPVRPLPASLSNDVRSPRRSRVLVVDDEPTLVEIVKEILETEHYEVVTASSGTEALAEIYRHRPDLVLTDLQMPGMNGLEMLQRIRADLQTAQVPVVFLTVADSLDTEVKALDLGADDYITKPIERARLLSRVRRAFFRAHLLRSAGA
jgi:type IV pilus assembly protein PilB